MESQLFNTPRMCAKSATLIHNNDESDKKVKTVIVHIIFSL